MIVRAQALYDLAVLGKKVHRGALKEASVSLLEMRCYEPLRRITFVYDVNGQEMQMNAADGSHVAIRMKILALFAVSQRYNYSKSSRDEFKRKLELDKVNCSNYMPELIEGKTREWLYDNLTDAIAALKKD